MAKIECCPHCGSRNGLYSKECVRYVQFYKWDGEPDGYSEFDSIRYRKSVPLYCSKCNKRVGVAEKLFAEERSEDE